MTQVAYNRPMRLDTDTSEASPMSDIMLDAMNVRITQNGGDLVLSTIPGMIRAFIISSGYSIVGSCQYNGVLYIASINSTTNRFEIGTFPHKSNGVIVEQYRPLKNYVGGLDYNALIRNGISIPASFQLDFNIPNLGYSLSHRLDMMSKEEYDGTVSLIIVDNENPNRVFNCGIDKNLNPTMRYINDTDIANLSIEQFNEQANLCQFVSIKLENDGSLKSGQYFFYIRYSNLDRSPTSFVAHSNPVSVYRGDGYSVKGGNNELTNKSVTLNIFGIDNGYAFFEIGYVRYSGGVAYCSIINNLYPISAFGQSVKITGFESVSNVEADDFLALKPYEKTCKSQTQVFNRWYGANWKSINRHHPDLANYAKTVAISETLNQLGIDDYSAYLNASNNGNWNPYDSAADVYSKVGYFSGETYMFLLHPVFKDGRIGLGYPMKGYDNYYNDLRNENTNGIFRFSSQEFVLNKQGSMLYSKQPKFDFPAIGSAWINENVSGWYISRAKRKENLLYQGYGCDVYTGDVTEQTLFYQDPSFNSRTDAFSIVSKETESCLPLIHPSSYYVARLGKNNTTRRGFAYGRIHPFNHGNQHTRKANKGAVFSTDYMIGEYLGEICQKDCFVKPLATVTTQQQGRGAKSSGVTWYNGIIVSNQPLKDLSAYHESSRTPLATNAIKADIYNVQAWSASSNNDFTSRVQEGSETRNTGGFYYLVNEVNAAKNDYIVSLPMATPAYLGVEANGININGKIVNVYKSDPTTININDLYDPKNEIVYVCSQFLPLNSPYTVIANGDCFVQRVFIKALHGDDNWSDFLLKDIIGRDGNGLNAGKSEKDGYGHILSFVSESKYNAAFRYEQGGNRFYPSTGFSDIGIIAYEYGKPESPFYDASYSQTIEDRILRGYNPQVFYGIDKYPTRIMYSSVQIQQGLVNAYRQVYPAQKQDFDLKYGEINCIVEQGGSILSFQERAINRHTIQEKVYSPSTDGSPVLLGTSNVLTEFVQKLSDYGTQHQWSVVVAPSGVYAVDSMKSVIVRVQEGVEAISITKKINNLTSSIIDVMRLSTMSNIAHSLSDSPLMDIGIHSIYDSQNREVVFTFLSENKKDTICFSELMDSFISRYGFNPTIYMNLNDDVYSFWDNGVFVHDKDNANHNRFYAVPNESFVKIVVGKDTFFEKRFDAQVITSSNSVLSESSYETINQTTQLNLRSAPMWNKPVYKGNQWYWSIPRASSTRGQLNVFGPESPMAGLYLIQKLRFNPIHNQGAKIWLKEVLTKFVKVNV